MGRIALLVALIGLAITSTTARANEIPGTQRNVLGWQVAAYDNGAGKFSHCGMSIPYHSGITLHYAIFANYQWRLGWSSASWNLTPNQTVPLSIVVDGWAPINLTAFAINKSLAAVDLPATASVFDLMRKGYQMRVYAVGNEYGFNLNGTYAALSELVSCVNGFARPTQPPAPPITGSTPTAPPAGATLTAEQRLEATTLVANLLSQGELTGYRILSPKEVQERAPALSSWHVVWSAEDVVGTMKILPKGAADSATVIASGLTAEDGRGCTGQFASGTTPDDKSKGTVRSFAACKADKLSWETHYIVVPRDEGGLYVFATLGKSETKEVAPPVNQADGLLRAAVFQVLKH
jgi:hypothetical protein